jgi:hypothetical protein
VNRSVAVARLVDSELKHLTGEEREALLLDWWSIDTADAGYEQLSPALRRELSASPFPMQNSDAKYDALLRIALSDNYIGALNSYLELRLAVAGHVVSIVGEPERLWPCPCCDYFSLRARGNYEICPVCRWEDDGSDLPDHYSAPNNERLGDARQRFGESELVNCDGTLPKYAKRMS